MGISPGYVGATPLWQFTLNADYPSPGVDLTGITASEITVLFRDTRRNLEFQGAGTVTISQSSPPALVYYQVATSDVQVASTYKIFLVINRPNGPDVRDPVPFLLQNK